MIGSRSYERAREAAIARSGVLARRGDPDLVGIVSRTAKAYRTLIAGVSIITGRRQVILVGLGTDIVETSREASFCQTTIQRPGEPLVVPDTQQDARFAHLSTRYWSPAIRFYAGFSIVDRNGYALGALCIADHEPHFGPFDPTELIMRAREVERIVC